MGISNMALYNRAQVSRWSQAFVYALAAISPVMFIPTFIITGIIFGSCGVLIPKNEEHTRKMLVDYLENNKLY